MRAAPGEPRQGPHEDAGVVDPRQNGGRRGCDRVRRSPDRCPPGSCGRLRDVLNLGPPAAVPALAGIADSPLPELLPGAKTVHLFSVPGIIAGGGLDTFFACTSTDTAAVQVGAELFGAPGGPPYNDAVATSLSVGPGATVISGTSAAVGISINSNLGGLFSKGSARILATSKNLACTAFIADPGTAPPTSMTYLTIIAKTKQKAAN